MFKKKKCSNCGEGIKESFNFCPICGRKTNSNENYGMLGKNDFEQTQPEIKLPMGLNMIFNSLMKNLDREFQKMNSDIQNNPNKNFPGTKKGISISISTNPNHLQEINKENSGQDSQSEEAINKEFTKDKQKSFQSLPRVEPKTNLKRLDEKIVYEIDLPEVNSEKDFAITKLENSIEIKAVSNKNSYFKSVPLNLPLINYYLSKEKLFLELKA